MQLMAPRKSQQVPAKARSTTAIKQSFKQVRKLQASITDKERITAKVLHYLCAASEASADEEPRSRPQRELRLTPLSEPTSIAFSYCGITYDFARWPGAILRAKGPQPGFENFDNFLAQENAEKCPPGCECREQDACPCVRNKTVCELACDCAANCHRRFVGCGCRDACSLDCWCHKKNRQCGDHCNCTNCGNDLDPDGVPRLRVQPSAISGAGEGLFCLTKISYKRFLGHYDGQTISQKNNTAGVVMDFRISKTQCIRPDREKSMLFKINYAQPDRANVQFLTFETAQGRKVLAFAVDTILPGTELLAWYGPECSLANFNQMPLSAPVNPTFTKKFVPIIKENGTGYEIRPLKPWQEYVSVISWNGFEVGQDVFVNFKKSTAPKDYPENISDERFIRSQLKSCWVARIMEIRVAADNSTRVVVVWYDRPAASPPSSFELFGIHYLDVIDGNTLSSRADVTYVRPGQAIPKDKLYYQYIQAANRLDPTRRAERFLWATSKRTIHQPKPVQLSRGFESLQPS